jgi:hypothetical protein
MKYTANCPSCDHEFEIGGIAVAKSGLQCPKCGTGFVPDQVNKVGEIPELVPENQFTPGPQKLSSESERLAEKGQAWEYMAAFFSVVGLGALAVLIYGGTDSSRPALYVFAGCVSAAIWIYLIAQLIHIRALLSKK